MLELDEDEDEEEEEDDRLDEVVEVLVLVDEDVDEAIVVDVEDDRCGGGHTAEDSKGRARNPKMKAGCMFFATMG